jgi:hypothetical protein
VLSPSTVIRGGGRIRLEIVSPDELKLLDCLLQKASAELRYEARSEDHQELASLLMALFETVKYPAELLAAVIRDARLGRF